MNETTKRELTEWLGLQQDAGHVCPGCGKGYHPTFDTANDIRLLTDKMREEGLLDGFKNKLTVWALTVYWIQESEETQADKIHEFLTTINEIQSGG